MRSCIISAHKLLMQRNAWLLSDRHASSPQSWDCCLWTWDRKDKCYWRTVCSWIWFRNDDKWYHWRKKRDMCQMWYVSHNPNNYIHLCNNILTLAIIQTFNTHCRAEQHKFKFCVSWCCDHYTLCAGSFIQGGCAALLRPKNLPLWLGQLDRNCPLHPLHHLCVCLQNNLHVFSRVAMAAWGSGYILCLDWPHCHLCQVPQHRHLHYNVWKDFPYISKGSHSPCAACNHVWTHLLHDFLWTTVSG